MFNSSSWEFIRYIFTDLFGFCYFVLPVILTFTGQLLLCFRAKRVFIKLLPPALPVLLIAAVYAAFLVRGGDLLYLYPLGLAGLILLGSVSAWVVYGVVRGAKSMIAQDSSWPNL